MMDSAQYLALYLAPLPAGARTQPLPSVLPALAAANCFLEEGQVEVPPLSLPQLFTAGVECGHTAARVELKNRIGTVNAQLEHFRVVRDRAQGDREQLAAEVVATQRKFHFAQIQMSEMQAHVSEIQLRAGQMHLHSDHLEVSLAKARDRMDHLQWELDAARKRVEELETSTTWKMTRPLLSASWFPGWGSAW